MLFLFLKHKNPRHARAGAKAKNVKAVMALLDLEGATLQDDGRKSFSFKICRVVGIFPNLFCNAEKLAADVLFVKRFFAVFPGGYEPRPIFNIFFRP